jgi:DNA-binding transcriptional LysR family regulator
MSTIDWNLARAFAATARAGSLSAAARLLALTQPTLSRQVAALEAQLGVALFERIGKRLVLTEAGLGLLAHAQSMAAAADAMALAAVGTTQTLTGRISISATDVVSAYLLPDIVARIRREAPQMTIAVVSSNSLSDLRRREADIAIRHVRPTEPELIGQLACEMTANFYASDTWIARNGMPTGAAALHAVDLMGIEPVEQFAAHLSKAGIPVLAERIRVVSENSVVLWQMVQRGLGIGVMLREVAERTPGVTRLLPGQPATPVPVWLVSHRELRTSRRVRLVFEILADELRRLAIGDAPGRTGSRRRKRPA